MTGKQSIDTQINKPTSQFQDKWHKLKIKIKKTSMRDMKDGG